MKKVLLSVVMIAVALAFANCGGQSGKALVTVGGAKITEGDLDLLGNINPNLKAQLASEFGKKKILDNLVEQELLYQASMKDGLERDPAVRDKIELYRKVIISQAYMDKRLNDTAKEYYDAHKDEFEKLRLSDIVIMFKKDDKDNKVKRSEKEALDLANKAKERIVKGEDFASVAKEVSEDPSSKARGGDLGPVSKGEPRFARQGFEAVLDKAFTMKVGEVGGPIKTEDSYHVITVTKGSELQPFDEALQSVLFKIRAKARDDIMADLRNKFKVEYLTEKKAEEAEAKPAAPQAEQNAPQAVPGAEQKAPEAKPEVKAEVNNPAGSMKETAKPQEKKK